MLRRTRPWSVLLAVMLPLFSGGCLVFENQVLVCVFSPDGEEVHALLVYEGLQVSGDQENNLKSAKEELTNLMTSRQNIYLAHPLFNVSLAPPKPDDKESEEAKRGRNLLQKHLAIGPGTLFVNPKGKLCGVQTVTLRDAQQFTAGLNELISLGMDQSIGETLARKDRPADSLDEETLRHLQQAARDRHTWLKLEPGRLSFSLPGTAKTFADFKRMALRDLLVNDLERLAGPPPKGQPERPLTRADVLKETQDLRSLIKFVAENPISRDQRRDQMVFSLGVGQGVPLRLNISYEQETPQRPNKHAAQLLEHARALRVEFKENLTTEALVAEFLSKHKTPVR
jgi:hypothetical protein